MRLHMRIGAILVAATAPMACVNLPRSAYASVRQAEYFAAHKELPPTIRTAIENGHVVVGMDREQVVVALGQPTRKRMFQHTEAWIYRGHKLHQDPLHLHGATLVRILFVEGRVVIIEPL